jgi:hypothetical protein
MNFLESLNKLKKSNIFIKWKNKNKNFYLTHGFLMIEPNCKKEWQIGFYNPKKDNIETFCVNEKVVKTPLEKVFKKKKKINELDLNKVKFEFEKASKQADEIQKTKYPKHNPVKKIFIIQNLDLGQVWNITYVTNTFNTLNIKLDSETGKVIKHELISLFRLDK